MIAGYFYHLDQGKLQRRCWYSKLCCKYVESFGTDTVVTYNITGWLLTVDYTVLSGTVTIPAGKTSVNIPVAVLMIISLKEPKHLFFLTNVAGDPDITLSATAADLTAQTEILIMILRYISITRPGASFNEDAGTSKLCCKYVTIASKY